MQRTKSNRVAARAAERFLSQRGWEILDGEPRGIDLVARDGGTIVFVKTALGGGAEAGFPEERFGRDEAERAAAAWLAANRTEADVPVRFDFVGVLVLSPDRALVRHHINALETPEG